MPWIKQNSAPTYSDDGWGGGGWGDSWGGGPVNQQYQWVQKEPAEQYASETIWDSGATVWDTDLGGRTFWDSSQGQWVNMNKTLSSFVKKEPSEQYVSETIWDSGSTSWDNDLGGRTIWDGSQRQWISQNKTTSTFTKVGQA